MLSYRVRTGRVNGETHVHGLGVNGETHVHGLGVNGETHVHGLGVNSSRKEEIWQTETWEDDIKHYVREMGSAYGCGENIILFISVH
jgi:hypothetical protein